MKNIHPSRSLLNKVVFAAMVPALLVGSVISPLPARAIDVVGKITEAPAIRDTGVITASALPQGGVDISAAAMSDGSQAPNFTAQTADESIAAAAAENASATKDNAPATAKAASIRASAHPASVRAEWARASDESAAGQLQKALSGSKDLLARIAQDSAAPNSGLITPNRSIIRPGDLDVANLRLGRVAPSTDPRENKNILKLADFVNRKDASDPNEVFNLSDKVKGAWGMGLNDKLGDCTIAAMAHMIMLWTSIAGKEVTLSDAQILKLYEVVAGYNPARPGPPPQGTDGGAQVTQVLNYWVKSGLFGDKLGAYAFVEPKDADAIRSAIKTFEGVYIGIALPISAQAQVHAGQPWSVVKGPSGRAGSWGGHAIPAFDFDKDGITVVTWGMLQKMTWEFLATYSDETYAGIDQDMLDGKGIVPSNNLNWQELSNAVKAIHGSGREIARK